MVSELDNISDFTLDNISNINSAGQYFGTLAKTPQLELSCKKILFFPKCSRMWCVAMSTNCRRDFSAAPGIDVTQLEPRRFWEAQQDLWDSASLPDTSREGFCVQISLSGLKPLHQRHQRNLWRASKSEGLQCSISPSPGTSEAAVQTFTDTKQKNIHQGQHGKCPRACDGPAGASSIGNWHLWLCLVALSPWTMGMAPGWLLWKHSWHIWSFCWARKWAAPSPDKHPVVIQAVGVFCRVLAAPGSVCGDEPGWQDVSSRETHPRS